MSKDRRRTAQHPSRRDEVLSRWIAEDAMSELDDWGDGPEVAR